ncbi:hypothetical protein EJ08DRAFT_452579 [Tothia fuscella]|uniref:Uncharacterized protein n=1 Tax=Tothia fuscella TaxID=1048955 RepID=A0A9P4NII3_9PEZI|nr:hypothetical protein EJ08DRAFT_452579 [Tothia fuscella]
MTTPTLIQSLLPFLAIYRNTLPEIMSITEIMNQYSSINLHTGRTTVAIPAGSGQAVQFTRAERGVQTMPTGIKVHWRKTTTFSTTNQGSQILTHINFLVLGKARVPCKAHFVGRLQTTSNDGCAVVRACIRPLTGDAAHGGGAFVTTIKSGNKTAVAVRSKPV